MLRRHAALRPLLPRGYHAYPVAGGRIYLDLRESPMMLARVLRMYEAPKFAALRQHLRPGDVFVDVGANKGDFALFAARLVGAGGRVIAVEPEPTNADWIERSVARNHYANVEVVRVALAERDGDAVLHLGEKSGWHSLLSTEGVATTGEVTVPTQTLDAMLAARDVDHVDAIKIDVEGAEERVLAGAAATFSGDHPMLVLLDVHPGRGVDPVAVGARLTDWGFTLDAPVTPTTKSITALRS
ncbi:MAG TPA: FkbM family methyltransferase [Acidimicrobiales bacterium]|nr:FkbM family methyltransferase [Acidimicrobiales bacterium]